MRYSVNKDCHILKHLFMIPLQKQVQLDYLKAGANVIITSSYQIFAEESEALLWKSVEIALEARELFYDEFSNGSDIHNDRKKPTILVPASVGSYGACLFLQMTPEKLKEFHRRRIEVLAESSADLIAFETILNKMEAQAYAKLLGEDKINYPAWFSFNSKDGVNVVSGDSLIECASIADSCKKVIAAVPLRDSSRG
ncbi:hypothetical protein ZIOFF_012842 [Zingiber officinale]|uniref:Hcy-binding domain-containing protein n=1 Tax=Zingiber officinale TaxID=94328 RepID=A0A8J5I872_ZINOF|nr:hypothetical protein ZIOFF_012842 [Zingiber officinale]